MSESFTQAENFIRQLAVFRDRYLSNVLNDIYLAHPELQGEIDEAVARALHNKEYDRQNSLLEKANLPFYPEHFTLKDFNEACIYPDQRTDYEKLIATEFLTSRSQPNLILYGPPDQGKEKLASALGDLLCRKGHTVLYIDYHRLIEVLATHGHIAASNTLYKKLINTECLIINDFAGKNIYDPDIIDELDVFLKERTERQIGKQSGSWKPSLTYVTTCYSPNDWCSYFSGNDMKVLSIINRLYGMGCTLNIDETNNFSCQR